MRLVPLAQLLELQGCLRSGQGFEALEHPEAMAIAAHQRRTRGGLAGGAGEQQLQPEHEPLRRAWLGAVHKHQLVAAPGQLAREPLPAGWALLRVTEQLEAVAQGQPALLQLLHLQLAGGLGRQQACAPLDQQPIGQRLGQGIELLAQQ